MRRKGEDEQAWKGLLKKNGSIRIKEGVKVLSKGKVTLGKCLAAGRSRSWTGKPRRGEYSGLKEGKEKTEGAIPSLKREGKRFAISPTAICQGGGESTGSPDQPKRRGGIGITG